jgi:spore germination protein GerM
MFTVNARATRFHALVSLSIVVVIAITACSPNDTRETQAQKVEDESSVGNSSDTVGSAPTISDEDSSTQPDEQTPNVQCEVDTPAPQEGERIVRVFFHCGDDILAPHAVAVSRSVPDTPAVLTTALSELLKGPTPAEAEVGLFSPFSAESADALGGIEVVGAQVLIDFNASFLEIPNIGTSNVGGLAYDALNRTVFEVDSIESIVYSITGDAEAWCELYGITCEPVERDSSTT